MLTAAHAGQQGRTMTHAKAPAPMMSMPWVAPLFIADQNFASTLILVNSTPVDGPTEVTLRSGQGATIVSQNIVVSPHTTKRLNIGQMLSTAGMSQATGSIVVMPMVANVAAQLSLTYQASYVDEELAMPMPDSSPVLRAVAEHAHGSPIVVMTSTSAVGEHITIRCLPESGRQFSKTLPLGPGASIATAACNASGLDRVPDILAAQPSDNSAGTYGIEVSSDGPAGGFSAFGLIAHRSAGAEFLSALPFLDPMMARSSSTVFAGVPLGTSAFLPVGNYSPAVAIANFGAAVAHVRVSLAHTVGSTASSVVVATQTVPPGQSLTLTPPVDPSILGLQNSFIVTSDAVPGALVSKVVSLGTGNLHEVELLGKDEQDPPNGGTQPWTLQDGSEAVLLLFNHTGKQQDVRVGINGIWRKTYHVETMTTVQLSVRDLVDQQVTDDEGHVLPTTTRDGVLMWETKRSSVAGRLLQANVTSAMARSFSCTTYNYIWDGNGATPVVIANHGNPTIVVGASITISQAKPYKYQSYVQYCDVNGTDLGTDPSSFTYLWSDDGPYYNLSNLNSTLTSYAVTGSAPGAESYSVDLDDGIGCGATGGGTVHVVLPKFDVEYVDYIPVDHVTGPNDCLYAGQYSTPLIYKGDGGYGTYRSRQYDTLIPDTHQSPNYNLGVGETRNYGKGSPFNLSTLSSQDEDGVGGDCYLWNAHGYASTSNMFYSVSFPSAGQGTIEYSGSTANPLEPSFGAITWDVTPDITESSPSAASAFVNYDVTCYPSHQVKINGSVVWLYTPSSNSTTYIVGCLTGILSHVTGSTSSTSVTPYY
jgi:hypothetical protein